MALPRGTLLLLLAVLAVGGALMYLNSGEAGGASVETTQVKPTEAPVPEASAPTSEVDPSMRSGAISELVAKGRAEGEVALAERLLLRFHSCTHAPTAVDLVSNGTRKAASVVDVRTWALPLLEATQPEAFIDIEFGESVNLILSEPVVNNLDIVVPALTEISITLSGVEEGWVAEWNPEAANGLRHAVVKLPLSIDGAKAVMRLVYGDRKLNSEHESAELLAPVGSSWTISAWARGARVEPPVREHVTAPSAVDFEAQRQPGIRVLGKLPRETILLVYSDEDPGSPVLYGRVGPLDAESTALYPKHRPLSAIALHHLEVVLPSCDRISLTFETDSRGAAEVSLAGASVNPPWVLSLGAKHELSYVYLFMGGRWVPLPSNPTDFQRETGAMFFQFPEAGEARILHAGSTWTEGYVVTELGAVAKIGPSATRAVDIEWLEASSAQVSIDHLPEYSAAAWRLSFAVTDEQGGIAWLTLAYGRGSVSELGRRSFYRIPALRMKLWTRVLDGDSAGQRDEIESPFR